MNGRGEQVRLSFALERARLPYLSLHNLGFEIVPFKLEKLKKKINHREASRFGVTLPKTSDITLPKAHLSKIPVLRKEFCG